MNFWQIFIRVFWWRPLPALGALWWQLTRRRVRARNRLRAAGASLPFAYKFWMRNVEQPQQLSAHSSSAPRSWESRPEFTVIVDARDCPVEDLASSIQSVEQQAYEGWDLVVVSSEPTESALLPASPRRLSSPALAILESKGAYIVPLKAGDQLSTWALFHFAEALQSQHDAAILYGDEDELDEKGVRRRPWFKPQWNEELFLARDYLSRACAVRSASARAAATEIQAGQDTWTLGLLLHVIARDDGPVVHLPSIIAHVRDVDSQAPQAARVEAVAKSVLARGGTAAPGPHGSVRVSWPLPDPSPLVSLLVPTRDKLELLRPCVESLLEKTTYENFELLVVDNGSVEPETLRYLHDLGRNEKVIRILPYPHAYNYSAINNHAARDARGAFLCLLNNDTEVVSGDWLAEMMRHAVRPQVGAVGAKLLYADGSIQHAGVIVGIGDAAGHPHRNLPADDPGYFGHAHLTQFVSAVTGACLLVDKRKFLAVGGLDEEHLPIAYNDIDLCLKLERAGWRNVYVPHAVLIHHESKSRAKDHAPARINAYRRELEAFQQRWGTKSFNDPLLNPNLDRSSETFLIRF